MSELKSRVSVIVCKKKATTRSIEPSSTADPQPPAADSPASAVPNPPESEWEAGSTADSNQSIRPPSQLEGGQEKAQSKPGGTQSNNPDIQPNSGDVQPDLGDNCLPQEDQGRTHS